MYTYLFGTFGQAFPIPITSQTFPSKILQVVREYSSNLSAGNFFFATRTSFQSEYQFIFSRYRVVSSVSRIASRLVCWRLVFSTSRRVYCAAGCITFLHQRIEK